MTKRSIFFFYRFPISRARLSRILSLSLSLSIFVHKTVLPFTHSSQALGYAFPTATVCILPTSPFSLCLATFHVLSSLSVYLHVFLHLSSPSFFPSFPSYLLTLPSSLFRRTSISLNKLLRATPFFVDVHRKNVCVNLFAIIVLTESNQRSIGGIHLGEMFDWNFIMYR